MEKVRRKIYQPQMWIPHEEKHKVITKFFRNFIVPVQPWMMQLVSAYKQSGDFPSFPTFIADYYTDKRDKEIAILSTLCMDWDGDVYAQVQAMRELMGDSPSEWFYERLFVSISTGGNQDRKLTVGTPKYWKIARFFDRIYKLCKTHKSFGKNRNEFSLERVFPASRARVYRSRLEEFSRKTLKEIEYDNGWEYKVSVVEIVLRTSDGIGMGLWKGRKAGEKCPRSVEVRKFLTMWMNEFVNRYWDFDETIRLFGFEKDTDFFYFFLAWGRLSRLKPRECSRFSTVFYERFDKRDCLPPWRWKQFFPTIEFKQ